MPKRPITAEDIFKLHLVSDAQMSPDGSQVLFLKSTIDKDKNRYIGNLFTANVESGEVKQWTQGDKPGGIGRWSPDGKQIAFVAGRDGPTAQIFLIPTDGGEARKLTSLPEGSVGGISWSPDGKHIAMSFREVAENKTKKAEKERKEKGGSPPPMEIDTLWYRMDGDGYFIDQRFKIYIVNVDTGEHKKLYDKDVLGFYSFDWLPNSSGLAIAHSVHRKEPLLKKPNDQVFIVPLKGKATMIPGLAKGPKGCIKVSPDGKQVAFLGDHITEEVWGMRNTRLYVAPMKGGEQRCLTDKSDFCLETYTLTDTTGGGEATLEWSNDCKKLIVSIGTEGTAQVGIVNVARGGVKLMTSGDHVLALGNHSANGKSMAMTKGTTTSPAEVAVFDGTEIRTLTSFNKDSLKEVAIAKPSSHWVTSADGTKVHTWCMKPTKFKKGKKYPAVLEIHGGPHAQYGFTFFHEFQLLAAQGYVVVYSNPRGSKGYGEAFCEAIKRDWGGVDWEDIQAVKSWMENQSFINPKKMGVMGGSYGGFMTNWAIGHTTDFKGAITDRCVFNWISMSGNSDFPLNRDDYFGGCAWGPLKNLEDLWRQSPAAYFHKVKTPTLVIHSEGDLRCNVEQGEQVFYVLKSIGVETRFVRYPANSSHGLSRNGPPDLRLHRLGEIVSWWKRWL